MRDITVFYQNGSIETFHEPFVSDVPPGLKPTSFNLRLDLLEKEGLLIEIVLDRYGDPSAKEVETEERDNAIDRGVLRWRHTARQAYVKNRLISKRQLYLISEIRVDNETIVWRQGDQLINGVKFHANELLYYSDQNTVSINAKIVELYSYLRKANPDLDDELIADRIGLNLIALEQIIDEEKLNLPRRASKNVASHTMDDLVHNLQLSATS